MLRFIICFGLIVVIVWGTFYVLTSLPPENVASDRTVTLDGRVQMLTRSLLEASKNIADIEKEVQARQLLADQLQKDARLAEQLKQINSSQVQAISQALKGQLDVASSSSFWPNFYLNTFFAVVGFALSEISRVVRERMRKPQRISRV